MVRAGRVTSRRANAAILFFNEIFGRQVFLFPIAPFLPHAFVQKFGECLRKAVRERFGHNSIVIVELLLELLNKLFELVAAGNCESAKVVGELLSRRRNKVSQAPVRCAIAFLDLLA